jgi:hypothetical protein
VHLGLQAELSSQRSLSINHCRASHARLEVSESTTSLTGESHSDSADYDAHAAELIAFGEEVFLAPDWFRQGSTTRLGSLDPYPHAYLACVSEHVDCVGLRRRDYRFTHRWSAKRNHHDSDPAASS